MRGSLRRDYCPTCDAERDVFKTVAWQADRCASCGHPVEAQE